MHQFNEEMRTITIQAAGRPQEIGTGAVQAAGAELTIFRNCRCSASASMSVSRAMVSHLPQVLPQSVCILNCRMLRAPAFAALRMSESVTELHRQIYTRALPE